MAGIQAWQSITREVSDEVLVKAKKSEIFILYAQPQFVY